jgi:membrane-bound lytic murein transglycosylase A
MKLTPLLLIPLLAAACRLTPDYARPLPPGAAALIEVGPGEHRPDFASQVYERDQILPALDRSIAWMQRPSSQEHFPIEGVTHERALASLVRFREILVDTDDPILFARRVDAEFTLYKSAGWNGRGGGVLFTGYCTPILRGSLTAHGEYRHPLYSLPPDLVKGARGEILGRQTASGVEPYPTRHAIEASALLEGRELELVWLADPIDAYIAHVNGSAFVELEPELGNAEMLRLGYAGKNGREYRSLGKALVESGHLGADEVSLASIRRWSRKNPGEVQAFLDRNESYVFFTPIQDTPRGSLNLPVEPGRTLATDKTIFPRGAIVYVDTNYGERRGAQMHRFMFDQDTGGAIRTAGRADMYLGIGPEAETLAGATKAEGQLYYLFLRE